MPRVVVVCINIKLVLVLFLVLSSEYGEWYMVIYNFSSFAGWLLGVWCVCWLLLETKEVVGESHSIAVDLDNVAHFGHVDKLVDESLTVDFGKNSALVIVPVDKGENCG